MFGKSRGGALLKSNFGGSLLAGATGTALFVAQSALPAARAEEVNPSPNGAGVSGLNLKDVVKAKLGFQGQTQAAGTPNELGIGGFLPLQIGRNHIIFADVLANYNLSDVAYSSSIVNTEVAGGTISTSSRVGYRWLNSKRSWMYGVNAGYDSRPLMSGNLDSGAAARNSATAFYQQVAINAEASTNVWKANVYALVPIGDTEQRLNSAEKAGALDTYGFDLGYKLTPALTLSSGYYYQHGDDCLGDSSGVRGNLSYAINTDTTIGVTLSYDDDFATRVSGDIKYRFGGSRSSSISAKAKQAWEAPVIQSLTQSPSNRDVRVHDGCTAANTYMCSSGNAQWQVCCPYGTTKSYCCQNGA